MANKKKGSAKRNTTKDNKKIQKIIGYIMIFFGLMIILIVWFKLKVEKNSGIDGIYQEVLDGKESKDGYMYNGFVFVKSNDLWYTKLQKGNIVYTAPFHYGPKEVDYIAIEGDANAFARTISNDYDGNFYITFDPLGENLRYIGVANGELSFNLVESFGLTPVAGCTVNETAGCNGAPIITCETADKPVIFFKQEGEPKVTVNGNCLTIYGTEYDLTKATDRLLFKWYKVIKE